MWITNWNPILAGLTSSESLWNVCKLLTYSSPNCRDPTFLIFFFSLSLCESSKIPLFLWWEGVQKQSITEICSNPTSCVSSAPRFRLYRLKQCAERAVGRARLFGFIPTLTWKLLMKREVLGKAYVRFFFYGWEQTKSRWEQRKLVHDSIRSGYHRPQSETKYIHRWIKDVICPSSVVIK